MRTLAEGIEGFSLRDAVQRFSRGERCRVLAAIAERKFDWHTLAAFQREIGVPQIVLHDRGDWSSTSGGHSVQLSNNRHYINSDGRSAHSPAHSSEGAPNGAANKNAAVNADPECFTKRQKRM